ncbi:hypothetical protein IC006_0487 [Sulfuracidifex tepidarius]|uniref:Uncharacterized protein n=1 Tax=Sulfuracidifex tepidarius TaxID=1294262 RepID=A0A510DSP5_9CREN|nr:hypothetical protein [Sulfuracidifex tepidarius]BBG23203.1 hypothetical protein IC006_0487 [Sulfuracidifex tepidarius]
MKRGGEEKLRRGRGGRGEKGREGERNEEDARKIKRRREDALRRGEEEVFLRSICFLHSRIAMS